MPPQIDVKKRFRFNGQEFDSVEAMTAEARAVYERALNRALAARGSTGPVETTTKIVFNGHEYASVDELPPALRAQYDRLLNLVDANHNGVPDALEPGAAQPPAVSVADQHLARLAAQLLPPEKRARYEAMLREADARLGGNPGALEFSEVPEFAAQVTVQTAPATTDEDAASAWLEGLAAKQSARVPQTPAPIQSPANFPVVSAEPARDRRQLIAALALLVLLLAGLTTAALVIFSQAGLR